MAASAWQRRHGSVWRSGISGNVAKISWQRHGVSAAKMAKMARRRSLAAAAKRKSI